MFTYLLSKLSLPSQVKCKFSGISLLQVLILLIVLGSTNTRAQDDNSGLSAGLEALQLRRPLCFGLRDIQNPNALAICEALAQKENVRARELSELWLRAEPQSAAAQFALAEVLLSVEGNMPRAIYHLNQAEQFTNYRTLEEALDSGQLQWHYLVLNQLSYVHQLMGDQLKSLEYLEKIRTIYSQDIESFRGWPLIKLKDYEGARLSANAVLQKSDDPRERARAWNTLCAADLASLRPVENMAACDETMTEDSGNNDYDTVFLTNASEVALSLLQIDQAESYLDRATRFLNPDSPADPWIYKLFLTMNQSRFDEAKNAMDRMLVWRDSQSPLTSMMNRSEHHMVSASFLLLAGYPEDTVKLTQASLNQPDRNGSYSADDFQKDAMAALINKMGHQALYEINRETLATLDFADSMGQRLNAYKHRLNAWRAGRHAASLFANSELLQNRLRPYAPLDIHIPEWIEPEIIALMGTGVMRPILEEALNKGAFMLNQGYYHAYRTEISALDNDFAEVLLSSDNALAQLPAQESLLKARVSLRRADAALALDRLDVALEAYELALSLDPSIVRRLGSSLPIAISHDGSDQAERAERYLLASPRFKSHPQGLPLNLSADPNLSLCLNNRTGQALSCYTVSSEDLEQRSTELFPTGLDLAGAGIEADQQLVQFAVQRFHSDTFGLGFDISKAQRSMLLGSSVILNSQNNRESQQAQGQFLSQ